MRSTIVRTCVDLARNGVDIHFLTADLGFKVLDPFREAFPERFTNAGVSEANMVSVAAGLAMTGKRPVCYSMIPFLFFRAFEQVRLDVVAPRVPVVLVGVGGGLSYGHEGMSHHAIEDLAIARSLPGLRVIAPGDPHEADAALRLAITAGGPTFIRLGQNNDPKVHAGPLTDLGRPTTIRTGNGKVVLVATGHILSAALDAATRLANEGIDLTLVSTPLMKPFDQAFIRDLARTAEAIVTVEEHSVIGGLGTEVAEILLAADYRGRFLKLGLPDAYCTTHGTLKWLREHYGIDAGGITSRVRELLR